MTKEESIAPVYLVRGDDPSLVSQQTRLLVDRLVGDRDPALVVEECGGSNVEVLEVGAVIDACTTPPFLIDRRVVIVRDAGRLAAGDATRLSGVLADPVPSIVLVLIAGGGTMPQALVKQVGSVGEVIDAAAGRGREKSKWLGERVKESSVRLNAGAIRRMESHLGEDVGRLDGLLSSLAAAYGEGATVSEDELEPFLGAAGAVPPWDLTDAIDSGQTSLALAILRRMTAQGARAPLEMLSILQRHFSRLLCLDGADVHSGAQAQALLGDRSEFTAKKALAQSTQLGSDRIAQAITLLSSADLDLKGRSALPSEVILEVVVARLTRLAGTRRPPRRR